MDLALAGRAGLRCGLHGRCRRLRFQLSVGCVEFRRRSYAYPNGLTGSTGYWQGCRTEGWLLDRHQACMTIAASQQQATVTIQTSGSW